MSAPEVEPNSVAAAQYFPELIAIRILRVAETRHEHAAKQAVASRARSVIKRTHELYDCRPRRR